MKKILIIALVGLFVSCTDQFEELNTDKKNPASVTGESLFNNGTERFYQILNNSSVNTNVFRLYSQYWSQCQYPEESQYNMVTRNIPDNWFARIYRDGLNDLNEAKRIISAKATNAETAPVQANKLAIIEITEVQMWATLVDLFGNVPYTEALDVENPNPKYDDAKTIYMDIISRLDAAIAKLDGSKASFSSNNDLVNQGDTGAWVKAANSLKLRLAVRISDVDAAKAKTMATAAIAGGVFSAVNEDLSMEYTSNAPYTNPVYEDLVLSGRFDYVASNTLVDAMNTLEDPRRQFYFRQNLGAGVYKGGVYGTNNNYAANTQLGDIMHTATTPGAAITCAEVEFLKAEAVERGLITGDAEEFYNNGVTASIMEWGGTSAMATAYLANPAVAYTTAEGNWKQKIGTQKWLALFNNGLEGWNSWKLLDFSGFNAPDGMTLGDIPTRLIYPVNEATLNGTSLNAAIAAIGGNSKTGKVFWDVK
jgi:hypothetical protein